MAVARINANDCTASGRAPVAADYAAERTLKIGSVVAESATRAGQESQAVSQLRWVTRTIQSAGPATS